MKKISVFDFDGTLINAYNLTFLSSNEAGEKSEYRSVDLIRKLRHNK